MGLRHLAKGSNSIVSVFSEFWFWAVSPFVSVGCLRILDSDREILVSDGKAVFFPKSVSGSQSRSPLLVMWIEPRQFSIVLHGSDFGFHSVGKPLADGFLGIAPYRKDFVKFSGHTRAGHRFQCVPSFLYLIGSSDQDTAIRDALVSSVCVRWYVPLAVHVQAFQSWSPNRSVSRSLTASAVSAEITPVSHAIGCSWVSKRLWVYR